MKTNKKLLAGAIAILLATGGFASKAYANEVTYVGGSINILENESSYDYFKRVISTDENLSDEEKQSFISRLESVKDKGFSKISEVYGDYMAFSQDKERNKAKENNENPANTEKTEAEDKEAKAKRKKLYESYRDKISALKSLAKKEKTNYLNSLEIYYNSASGNEYMKQVYDEAVDKDKKIFGDIVKALRQAFEDNKKMVTYAENYMKTANMDPDKKAKLGKIVENQKELLDEFEEIIRGFEKKL